MAARSHHSLSIVEAVETLSNIADLEFDREVGIAHKHEMIISNEKVAYKTVHWLHKTDTASTVNTVNLVRETFRLVLHYLRQFYQQEYPQVTDAKTLEGIKTVMILVGEAAKKLDRYTHLFHQTQSVRDFKEYRQLQEFYRNKIAKKVDQGVVNQKFNELAHVKPDKGMRFKAAPKKTDKLTETKHLFINLETVKKDTEYELFFIRKEDGSRFFSSRLLRNMKLVCDFGTYFGERKELDPLEQIKQWYDRCVHTCAREIMKSLGSRLDHFFQDLRSVKNQELVEVLNKALLALMFSSHSRNLLRHHPVKSCAEYFEDFQKFLRECLQTTIYQKWMKIPPKKNNQLAFDLIEIVQTLCRALYVNLQGLEEVKPHIQNLIHEAHTISRDQEEGAARENKIWGRLASDYESMTKLIKHHSNGPLLKILQILQESRFYAFDPLSHYNLPHQLFDLFNNSQHHTFLRLPAPIYQEFINKAVLNEEFQAFIRLSSQGDLLRKHLLINLQDRTTWREYARCIAIESFQDQPEAGKALTVITLTTNTDFYHQLHPYHQINHADLFKEQFKEFLLDDHSGYFFPPAINKQELSTFIERSFEVVHRLFFSSKNVLTRENRLDFIEIFYLLLQLKLIEWIQPNTISLTCKDGIDVGEAYNVGLFAFLKLINGEEWTEADWLHVNFMLYAPALLIRERLMLPERFNRMLSVVKLMENISDEQGASNFAKLVQQEFKKLFSTPIAQSKLFLPRNK